MNTQPRALYLSLSLSIASLVAITAIDSWRASYAASKVDVVPKRSEQPGIKQKSGSAPIAPSQITLAIGDMVYDPVSGRIYASVPAQNNLVSIDPITATVVETFPIGSQPSKLCISDDHRYIYVALDGVPGVRRFDITSRTAGLQFQLGNYGPNEPYYVEDMAAVPGQRDSVAISRKIRGSSPRHGGVAVYDNGIQRPVASAPFAQEGSNVIEFSASSGMLYGYNNETTERGFRRMSVTASGVSIQSITERILYFGNDFRFDNGFIYSTAGEIINPSTLRRVGLIPGLGAHLVSSSLVLPDSTSNQLYFLAGGGSDPFFIAAFNQSTFIQTAFATLSGVTSFPKSFIRWGTDGLAFSSNDKVFILRASDLTSIPPTPLPTPTVLSEGTVELLLDTNDLVYDQNTDKLYVTVPSYTGSIGNSLISIDPRTLTPDAPIWLGSDPSVMARSNDGQYIYVAMDGGGSVRRFEIPTRLAGLDFTVGLSQGTGSRFALDLAALPNNPNAVAIARLNVTVAPLHEGVAIYDHGSALATAVSPFNASTDIEFSSTASTLYGFDGGNTAFQFRKMGVSGSGVGLISTRSTVISGLGTAIKYDNGRVYSSNGEVIDPESGATLGTFSVSALSGFFSPGPIGRFSHAFVPDSTSGRTFFITGTGASSTLQAFDQNSFQLIGSLSLPFVRGNAGRLIRWGTNGLAFNTSEGQLVSIQTSLVPPSPGPTPTPTPTPTPSPQGSLQLILEDSDSMSGQAAALQSTLFLRDPFWVYTPGNFLTPNSDRNTRVLVFVRNLPPGQPAASVVVVLGDSNSQNYLITAEVVASVPGTDLSQVVFKLPSTLNAGTSVIQVNANGQFSNPGILRFRNF